MTNKHELLGAPKHANQHRLSRLIMEAKTDELGFWQQQLSATPMN